MADPTPRVEAYSPSIHVRLARKLKALPSGCIVWTGSRSPLGYGRIGRGSREAGTAFAHRVAWELENGPIPEGQYVLHRCDNPPCCNTDHLFLGTLSDNTQDMLSKGRADGHIPAGEAHPHARLSDEQVRTLRALAPMIGNHAELGRMFGITKQHARALVLGQKRSA